MNWLDIVLLVFIGLSFVKGLFDGLIKQVMALVAVVLAIFLSGTVVAWLSRFVHSHLDVSDSVSPEMLNAAFYILAFVIVVSLLIGAGNVLSKAINVTPIAILDKASGALGGAAIALILSSLILNGIAVFDPASVVLKKEVKTQSVYYEPVKAIFPAIYPPIKDYILKK